MAAKWNEISEGMAIPELRKNCFTQQPSSRADGPRLPHAQGRTATWETFSKGKSSP
jgi:hypothetical protein